MKQAMEGEIRYGGGSKIIQFLHANGYGPECYRKCVEHMDASNYSCFLPLLRPLQEGAKPEEFHSWEMMSDDLIVQMDQKGRKNVIGLGHSMGGITTWLAAIKRPDLFKEIILIDPVIMPKKFRLFRLLPLSLRSRFFPIVQIAKKRRDQWESQQAIVDHLRSKKVYQRFDKEVWNDFLKYSFIQQGDHLTLKYTKEWEARIYATVPFVWNKIKQCNVPVTIIKAEFSDVITAGTWSQLSKTILQANLVEMKGVGHLMPFEKPIELGEMLGAIISKQSHE